MRHRRAAALACCLATPLLARCAGDDLKTLVTPASVGTSTRDADRAAELISEYRASRGLGRVVVDERLNRAAEHQARAVAALGRLTHGAFDERMTGFKIGGTSAENLSAGSDDVASAIARWKRSPGHDANLRIREVRRIGLARADTPGIGFKHYWALVLAQ